MPPARASGSGMEGPAKTVRGAGRRSTCGVTKTHPDRPGASNTYYMCQCLFTARMQGSGPIYQQKGRAAK